MTERIINQHIEQFLEGTINSSDLYSITQELTIPQYLQNRIAMSPYIIPYLDGELSGKLLKKFELALESDNFLRTKTEEYQYAINLIKFEGEQMLRNQFALLDEELDKQFHEKQAELAEEYERNLQLEKAAFQIIDRTNKSVKEKENFEPLVVTHPNTATLRSKRTRSLYNRTWMKAAILLLFLLPTYFLSGFLFFSDNNVYTAYYQDFEEVENISMMNVEEGKKKPIHAEGTNTTTNSAAKPSQIKVIAPTNPTSGKQTLTSESTPQHIVSKLMAATLDYEDKAYESAIQDLTELLPQIQGINDRNKAQFYLGLSYLGTEQLNKAIANLQQVEQQAGMYAKDARWYKGLAHLKSGDKAQAKQIFQQIAQQQSAYSKEAQQILTRLSRQAYFPFM